MFCQYFDNNEACLVRLVEDGAEDGSGSPDIHVVEADKYAN